MLGEKFSDSGSRMNGSLLNRNGVDGGRKLADIADVRFKRGGLFRAMCETSAKMKIEDDEFAVMPPLEKYLGIPEAERKERFFKDALPGNLIVGQVTSVTHGGLLVALLAYELPNTREIWDLKLEGLVASKNLLKLSENLPFGYAKDDFVRCEYLGAGKSRIVVLGMKGCMAPKDWLSKIPLGKISELDIPLSYWRSRFGRNGAVYDELLRCIPEFHNPMSVDLILQKFRLNARTSCSFMSFSRMRNEMAAEEQVKAGTAHMEAGRLDSAIVCFEKAIKRHPQSFLAHLSRGTVLASQAKYLDALPEFRTALRLKPDAKDARKFLIDTLIAGARKLLRRRPEVALALYKECLGLQPDCEEAERAVERLSASVRSSTRGEEDGSSRQRTRSSLPNGGATGRPASTSGTKSNDGNGSGDEPDIVEEWSNVPDTPASPTGSSFSSSSSSSSGSSSSRSSSPTPAAVDLPAPAPLPDVRRDFREMLGTLDDIPVDVPFLEKPASKTSGGLPPLPQVGPGSTSAPAVRGKGVAPSGRGSPEICAGGLTGEPEREKKAVTAGLELVRRSDRHYQLCGLDETVKFGPLASVGNRIQTNAEVRLMRNDGKCDFLFRDGGIDPSELARQLERVLRQPILLPEEDAAASGRAGAAARKSSHTSDPSKRISTDSELPGGSEDSEEIAVPPPPVFSPSNGRALRLVRESDGGFALCGLDASVTTETLDQICEGFQMIRKSSRPDVSKYTVSFDGSPVILSVLTSHLSESLDMSIDLLGETTDFCPPDADPAGRPAREGRGGGGRDGGTSDEDPASDARDADASTTDKTFGGGLPRARPAVRIALPQRRVLVAQAPPLESDFTPVSDSVPVKKKSKRE